jgi:DNA-binding Xre family transcriptional regulator
LVKQHSGVRRQKGFLRRRLARGIVRIRGDKSQNEFSRRAGVSGPTINRIENQIQNVSLETLEKLCIRLNCDVGDLLPPDKDGK